MTLNLPDVTLVMVDTREHELARLAVSECMAKVACADVLILTDDQTKLLPLTLQGGTSLRFHMVPDWPDKRGWSRSFWMDVPPLLRTSHSLNIQWDSWIWRPEMWSDEFLDYDYIGAPWWYKDGKNVGNGGFSLISARLKRYVAAHAWDYPCTVSSDDDLLCRKYRPRLEERGFRWAPERLARRFSFECIRPSVDSQHFGFHAMFNWPKVLSREELFVRLRLAFASPHIRESYMMDGLRQNHPQIMMEYEQESALAAAAE